jgi:HEAT repeat protein
MTLWSFLGIPQAANKIRDAATNRLGNSPDSERTNPLTRIADPANLQSPNPSIQAAAKIKQQEDLAPQKIKAIKYLATVGCGCYQNKKGVDVRAALLDSLDDCTEEVRYEAAKALAKVAGDCCDKCGDSCCNAKVMNKLKELADGTDERCCQKEPSERVRQAARQALNACKNKLPVTNTTSPEVPEKIPEHPISEPGGTRRPEAPMPSAPEPPARLPPESPLPGTGTNATPTPAVRKVGYAPASTPGIDAKLAVMLGPSSSTPEAPLRLRLVIGEGPEASSPEVRAASNAVSPK